jgi:hypothetical protein
MATCPSVSVSGISSDDSEDADLSNQPNQWIPGHTSKYLSIKRTAKKDSGRIKVYISLTKYNQKNHFLAQRGDGQFRHLYREGGLQSIPPFAKMKFCFRLIGPNMGMKKVLFFY